MLKIGIMIEGQNGLTWERWQKIVRLVEDLGFWGLFRSDHYTNANPPDKESLELWTSLTWLAANTRRIQFGPLVSPLSFRHPTMTARMAAAVDDLSEGRLILGLGAGWQEREHHNYGWDLLPIPARFNRFEEGLAVITRLLTQDSAVDFNGQFYRLREGILLPRPKRPGGPPILIGGNGSKRTLPLVAQYAHEWNSLFLGYDQFQSLNAQLRQLLKEKGRDPQSVRRSMMTGCIFGENAKAVRTRVKARTNGKRTPKELRQQGRPIGTATEIADVLAKWSETGLERIMLQWLDLDDLDGLEALAKGIL